MKVDKIIKNAKIFTADKTNPEATALVVKDGKFIYVGDEAGLSAYEGEVTDLGGKFIMPGIIDSHVIWIRASTSCVPARRKPSTSWPRRLRRILV